MMRDVVTFIMAGGKGERLYPLTRDRAKPAVPFGGIYRIIDFTLSNCINSGIRKILVLIQYKSFSLQRHLSLGWTVLQHHLGEYIEVIPAQQRLGEHWYLGTADAVYQNLNALERDHADYVLVLAGDHVYKMNYEPMLAFHQEQRADVTVGVIEMPASRARDVGIVEVDSAGQIVGFQEKPQQPKTIPGRPNECYVSMGIYLFSRAALERVLADDAKRTDSAHDFGKDVIPRMLASSRLFAYNFRDENSQESKYWRDVGTLDAYYEANMGLVEVTPQFNLYDQTWPIRTHQEQWPPAKTVFADEATGRLGMMLDSLVSNGCIISGGKVQRCVLSPNVRVNSFAEVYDSILMESVDVGRYAKIRRAIIDKDVKIPRYAQIGYDLDEDRKRFHVTEGGVVVVAKGTVVDEPRTAESLAST